jgi:multidrug efflux pump subunit AcrA (membrane-fusion protein)
MDGKVYDLYKEQGEMITPQMPLGIIGDMNDFILELQVDEYDITLIKPGQAVKVTMDSYKGEVFDAVVTRVYPIMNERTKSATVEAIFTRPPATLYPNLSLEANILLQVKENVLTIPRSYLLKDRFVIRESGDTIEVKTGIQDYLKAEILDGINEKDILIRPGS